MNPPPVPRIRIVLAQQNAGWVIGKMGQRLCEQLLAMGCAADLAADPDPGADLNHWMSFAFAPGCPQTLNSMFITHADDPYKVALIKRLLGGPIQMGLCMSPHAADELAGLGVERQRLWHVLPALDAPVAPRRIRVGITTRVYDDGRKRESLLVRLADEMPLDAFSFRIFGSGWEAVVPLLERAGAEVMYDPGCSDWLGDYERIRRAIPDFDYYLYLGMDEGSLGTLDALSAGVRTIVTAQGFHLSLPGGIDHPFTDYAQVHEVFAGLAASHRERAARLTGWTWEAYAREHLAIWKLMLAHQPGAVPLGALAALPTRDTGAHRALPVAGRIARRDLQFRLRMLSPTRIRGAIARLPLLQPLRRFLGH